MSLEIVQKSMPGQEQLYSLEQLKLILIMRFSNIKTFINNKNFSLHSLDSDFWSAFRSHNRSSYINIRLLYSKSWDFYASVSLIAESLQQKGSRLFFWIADWTSLHIINNKLLGLPDYQLKDAQMWDFWFLWFWRFLHHLGSMGRRLWWRNIY